MVSTEPGHSRTIKSWGLILSLAVLLAFGCSTKDETEVNARGDGAPVSDFNATTCGNGTLEGGESCDTKIPAGQEGACPTRCAAGESCTRERLVGVGCQTSCQRQTIERCDLAESDGCCPAGCDNTSDLDCEAKESCGNGKLELGERCDTAIAPGMPGACPTHCDDGQACTTERLGGSGCDAMCVTTIVTECQGSAKDGCCPNGCTNATDPDCSASCGNGALEEGESCDTKIASGERGACRKNCDDQVACTVDSLVGSGCNLGCAHTAITSCDGVKGDGCCPAGCDATNDRDCSATCGNGVVEPGEACDTKLPAGQPGSCPQDCDDGVSCTADTVVGSRCGVACSNAPISACSGARADGCCPQGCTSGTDADCPASCGNGVLDKGETCDTKIPAGQKGACPAPSSCDDKVSCTADRLVGSGCTVACSNTAISSCSGAQSDGCCPAGCDANSDRDCSPSCGNGAVEPGEACDTKIPAGKNGACPTSCDDGAACTLDKLVGSGCSVACSNSTISACGTKDGCCPQGCNANSDPDCSASCGNGALESGESCDTAIPAGQKGSCPTGCDDGIACTLDKRVGSGCSAACSHPTISACGAKDGCCPQGCNANSDPDCSASCGNGALEGGESCDTAIPAGQKGSCPTNCDDGIACTTDTLVGSGCSAACSHSTVNNCGIKDGCCPQGCNANTDGDCKPICGNGQVETGESCDTAIPAGQKGSCPTNCEDGDPCSLNLLSGSGCTARCAAKWITTCEAQIGDKCCPKGCNGLNDVDCPAVCGNGFVEKGEYCDTAIAAGVLGTCPSSCDDGNACTADGLGGSGCRTQCLHKSVGCNASATDRCCPKGCNANTDRDCPPVCGNGLIEIKERCDTGIAAGGKGACPTSCDDRNRCTKDTLAGSGCGAYCLNTAITKCSGSTSDGCCPTGCNTLTDRDCQILVLPCDQRVCGTRDKCCPKGCTYPKDLDCPAIVN